MHDNENLLICYACRLNMSGIIGSTAFDLQLQCAQMFFFLLLYLCDFEPQAFKQAVKCKLQKHTLSQTVCLSVEEGGALDLFLSQSSLRQSFKLSS